MRGTILGYLFYFCLSSLYAQLDNNSRDTAQLFYRHFTVQDGLPSNEVYSAYQDKTGYIWVCTDNGVSRFDGVRFKNYNGAEGLRSQRIYGCKEDPKGNLWMYSFAGELYRYLPAADRFESPRFNDSLAYLLAGRAIQDLVFEKDTLYVVTAGAYVKLTTTPRTALRLVEGEPMTLSVKVLSNGELLVINSTEENVTRFNFVLGGPGSSRKEEIRNIPINGLVQQQLSALKNGHDLYVVFGENFFSYNFASRQHSICILPFSHIPALKHSSAGILSGSHSKGLWTLRKEGEQLTYRQLIKNKNISGCFEDRQKGIWACSQTDGIYFIPSRTVFAFLENEGEASRRVTSMFTLGDTAFYMTYSGAMFRITTEENKPLKQRLIEPGQYIMKTMKVLNHAEILLFPAGRTMNYTIASGKIGGISPKEICERGSGNAVPAVVARKEKLMLRSCGPYGYTETVLNDNWNYGEVLAEALDRSKLWLATTNELLYMDAVSHEVSEVGRKNGLTKFSVRYILPLGKDSVMLASNQGIFLVVKDQIKKSITVADGLSSNKINTLFLFEGELWAGTAEGIDRIKNYRSSEKARVVSVTGLTGISKCPVGHLGCIGNYLVAGTDEGIYLFDRKQLLYEPVEVSPVITGLTVNSGEKFSNLAGELDLAYDQNTLDIYFNALNYRNSLLNTYRYRLDNEKDWSYTTQNHVLFPLLSPGSYDFEVQAMNPDGSWSKATSIFHITIAKPFWLTWWFITFMVLGAGAGAYFILLYRIRQLQKVGDLTSKFSEAKMQALGMQLNPHFVFNALSSVTSHVAKNDPKSTMKVLSKFAKLMRLVFRNSQHAIIPLEDELKALNLYIELETLRLGKSFNCDINVQGINVAECKVPSLLLQPFVENAIWHGIDPLHTEGKLDIVFMRIGDTLQIEVTDNGIGRYNASLIKPKDKRVHSLDIIKERLALLRSNYNCYTHLELSNAFEDREHCGTKVLLILPWLSDSETMGRRRILKHFMFDNQSAYN